MTRTAFLGVSVIGWVLFIFTSCKSSERQEHYLQPNADIMFGLDVSHYQGDIDWNAVANQEKHPIEFVFIRATMGKDRKDAKFQHNWRQAISAGFIVGAYHYYDPNEHSLEQAANYLKTVRLQKGNFIPVVDIERLSKIQSNDRLRLGLQRWLDAVERAYGVKPMIYTGHSFFRNYLLHEFSDYPLWIAAYSNRRRSDPIVKAAAVHQFAETVRVPGIRHPVDGNDIKREEIERLVLP